jgi:hypothetical protein
VIPFLSARGRRRRAWFGLLTVLGLRERGFFIPYRYADGLPKAGERPAYGAVEALFDGQRELFRQALGWLDELAEDLLAIGSEPPPAPRWEQDWFPRLDGAMAYAVVRKLKPRRIVEVGAGHSTRFLARAVADGGLDSRITTIDPAPRADLAGLPIELLRATVHAAGSAPFDALAPGDLLTIDSSHILMPGSDLDILLGHILPTLPDGVLLHVHDIFLPDDYPQAWAWRGYNEQLGILPLLFGDWPPFFASHYVATRMAEDLRAGVAGRLPLGPGAHESGLWLRKGGEGHQPHDSL